LLRRAIAAREKVHLGLGVYDSHSEILLEAGAYNLRAGGDALGHQPPHGQLAPGEGSNVSSIFRSLGPQGSCALSLYLSQS
jgi:hypothetical protein